jgi:uncharacterized protein YfaS (alpha-2-macroglobulin family)
MKRTPFRSLLCAWLAASIGAGGCRAPMVTAPVASPNPVDRPAAIAAASPPAGRPQIQLEDDTAGRITMRTADPKVASGKVEIANLDDAETAALHARMEPLPDVSAFNAHAPVVRPPSAVPASSGGTTPIAFVVPTGRAVTDAPIAAGKILTPLQAPQITPRDEVRAESEIRVRFSEPMIPVAAVGTVATPKIVLRPAVQGSWRWIDTRVVQFTAKPRLPQATEFEVVVEAGVEAISGAKLMTATSQKFSTPPIQLAGTYPRGAIRPDAPIAVRFDHDGDPAALAAKLRVTANQRPLAFKTIELDAAKALWARDPSKPWNENQAELLPKRFVVLAPQGGAWPAGTELAISLDKNAPSAEGPRLSREITRAAIDVVPAFALRGIACQQNPNVFEELKPRLTGMRCPADGWLSVELTNHVAVKTYRAQKFQIAGEGFEDRHLNGKSVGMTTPTPVGRGYRIEVGDGLEDIYGQPLVGSRTLSFVTGPEQFSQSLTAPSGLHVLDPRFEIPQWVVHASSVATVRVQLYQVAPKDYFAFTAFEADPKLTPPGKKIFDETHAVGGRYAGTLRADLRPALKDGFGHVVAVANVVSSPGNPRIDRITAWIQVTRMGASARIDAEKLSAFVHELSPTSQFLAPRAGVDAALILEGKGEQAQGTSDAHGKLALELLPRLARQPNVERPRALLRLTDGADTAFAVFDRYEKTQRVNDALWYVTDDRFTYKPGESVYVKGWVRWTHNGPNPDLELPKAGETIAYTLTDSRGSKIASGTLPLTAQGGFDVELALPNNTNLGRASFTFQTRGDVIHHPIAVQEFRTPAYSVALDDDVSHRGSIPLIVGESIEMTTSARYYAGGGLGGASIAWLATLTTTRYAPPGWSSYAFDPPRLRSQRAYSRYQESGSTSASQTGSLSGASTASMTWGLAALPNRTPSVLAVDATVTDVDRMSIRASSRPILVHPSAYYVGLRMKPRTVGVLQAIVTDIDGNVVEGVPVEIAVDAVLGSEQFRDDAKVVDTTTCTLTSAASPVDCRFKLDINHAYTGTAKVADARGRENVASMVLPWWGADDKKELQIVADKKLYQPGDLAKLEIRSKLFPAAATLTFARQGVMEQKRIELTAATTTVEVPITINHLKNLIVQVDRYGKRRYQRGTAPLPEVVSTEVELKVDVESARLDVRTRPSAKLVQPGDEATFEIDVQRDGKPIAGAEVALIVVDEAILSLSAGSHADPLLPFYRDVAAGTWGWNTLGLVRDSGDDLAGRPGFQKYDLGGAGVGGAGTGWGTIGSGSYGTVGRGVGGGGSSSSVVAARKDFRPTAVFSPTLRTDKRGHVAITVKMPDSLTRFRIVALATSSTNYFGKGENTIVTQRKVNARTIAPRFLTQGDQFSLPVVVQNLDSKPRTVQVAVRAANLLGQGPAGKRVTIPAGQRAEVRFDFATQRRGKAVIQTIMTSGPFADASNVELPIYEPATTEAFATYGVVDGEPQRERLAIPKDVFPEVGGVEVEVASTQLQSLVDAYWYLQAYPYECAEQRSGRMLATSAMYDILDAFATPGRPTRVELDAQRTKDVVALGKTQNPDGGWGYFGGMRSDPTVSMQVVSALGASRATGPVVQRATAFATKELTKAFDDLGRRVRTPDRKPRPDDAFLVSLAAHSLTNLASIGQDMRGRAEQLHAIATAIKAYPVDAKARVLALLAKLERAKAIRTTLTNDLLSVIHETAAAATVTTSYVEAERLLLPSSGKTNALVLDALIKETPDHALIQKLARGVLESRKSGRWRSTQENLVSLQAMRRYFDTYEKATPNYVGKLWLGNASYAEQSFIGRSTAKGVAQAGWTSLAPGTAHDLVFARDGSAGRLYYRVGIVYAPKQVDLPALDAGFIVRRSYAAADDPADVIKNADGSYRIKLGAKVVVTIEATNTTTRHGVALVDPMPAGFEAVNTALAIAERGATRVASDDWEHENLRDNRAEAFSMELAAGTHRYAYTVRATTPGTFIAAPAKAEEMYAPETFGRSTGLNVVVE